MHFSESYGRGFSFQPPDTLYSQRLMDSSDESIFIFGKQKSNDSNQIQSLEGSLELPFLISQTFMIPEPTNLWERIKQKATQLCIFSSADLAASIWGTYSAQFGICLDKVIPKEAFSTLSKVSSPNIKLKNGIVELLGAPKEGFVEINILSSVLEESQFRILFQDVLLKRLPEALLDKIAPNHGTITGSISYRMLRVFLTSMLFAGAHTHLLACEDGGAIAQLLSGLIYGSYVEFYGDYLMPIILHSLSNLVFYYLEDYLAV
jgi:hypothetical protein